MMTKKESIRLFEDKKVRTIWDDEQEKWYFSISDIVEVLTDSKDPKQYIKKMKRRDPELKSNWGTIYPQVQMTLSTPHGLAKILSIKTGKSL